MRKKYSIDAGGGGYYSSTDDDMSHHFSDRILQKKKKQSGKYQLEQIDGIPVISIPKGIKYLRIYHKFKPLFTQTDILQQDVFAEEEEEEEEDDDDDVSECSSAHSTPLLFAMEDMAPNSPKKKRENKRKRSVNKLSLPPFYCNLSKCRKSLIEANVILNDVYLINQLMEHRMPALKNVVLSYSSSEHNRYLSLHQFCSSYAHLYNVWDEMATKHTQIVLDNSMYDGWRYSVYKHQITQFLELIFNKNEDEIIKEQELYFDVNRFSKTKSLEHLFVAKISKCTDFFH